ncbi:MFS transporter [Gracilibacillus dipsosauri]|nr:MFS transporter [Gracilibacillus dipsosauri]
MKNIQGRSSTNMMEPAVELEISDNFIHTMVFTMVISMMSATMFNIVLPEISQEYGLTYTQVSWISSAYLLVYAIGSAIYGKLSDRFRLKSLLTVGILLLSLGSLIGLAAQFYWMVLFSRFIQAAGASVIPALAMIIPARYITTNRRGKVFGIMASGLALGGVLGPIASAIVADFAHWRWLFVVPLLTLVTLPLFRHYLASEKVRTPSVFDWIGGLLLGGTVATLLLAITGERWSLAISSIALFLMFVTRIHSTTEPFIEPRLFQNGRYSVGILLTFLVSAIGYSIPFLTPIMLVDTYHLSPVSIGLVMIPASLTAALLGKQGGKLADKRGNTRLFLFASLLLLSAFFLLSFLIGRSLIFVAMALIIGQVGQTFIVVAMSNTIANTLTKEQTGVGMGLMSMLNFIASSVSGAVISLILDQGALSAWNPFYFFAEGSTFSNLYLMFSLSYTGLILIYITRFGYRTPLKLTKN